MKFTFQEQENKGSQGPFTVPITYLPGKEVPKQIKILPAFEPDGPDGTTDPLGYIPFVDNDTATAWHLGYWTWSNIGHGPWGRGGNRKSFVRFNLLFPDYKFDAVGKVVEIARQYDEWRYLFDKVQQPGGKTDSVLRWFPEQNILVNAVILTATTSSPAPVLASLSSSLTKQLIGSSSNGRGGDAEVGIVARPSGMPEDYIAQHPMARYWLGDITDPVSGVVLEIFRDESGGLARYRIRPATNSAGTIIKMGTTREAMAARVNLAKPETFIKPPTPQEEVDRLASCLNAWAPGGSYHEYELLKLAFEGDGYRVPNPPAKGSVNGFVPPVATETTTTQTQRVTYPLPPQQPTQARNTTRLPPPAYTAQAQPQVQEQPPAPVQPQYTYNGPAFQQPQAPAFQQPAQAPVMQPPMQQPVQPQAPVQAQFQPAPAPEPAQPVNPFKLSAPPIQQPQPAPVSQTPPVVAGSDIDSFNSARFLQQMMDNG